MFIALVACTTTQTRTVTWVAPPAERIGEVSWIRQTVRDQRGNPAGGAVLGALVGGLFGSAIGRTPGAVIGAAGGAAAGAALSQDQAQETYFDVGVRFLDGGGQVFRFPYPPQLVAGQRVAVIGSSLRPLDQVSPTLPPGPPPQFVPPPPPPPPGGLWPPPPPS